MLWQRNLRAWRTCRAKKPILLKRGMSATLADFSAIACLLLLPIYHSPCGSTSYALAFLLALVFLGIAWRNCWWARLNSISQTGRGDRSRSFPDSPPHSAIAHRAGQ